jgi:hypothetical protein
MTSTKRTPRKQAKIDHLFLLFCKAWRQMGKAGIGVMALVKIRITTLDGALLESETLEGYGRQERVATAIIETLTRLPFEHFEIVSTPSIESDSGEEE